MFAKASSIYWHPDVSGGVARQVEGRIRDKWRDLGWENSRLKYPTTDEIITPDGPTLVEWTPDLAGSVPHERMSP